MPATTTQTENEEATLLAVPVVPVVPVVPAISDALNVEAAVKKYKKCEAQNNRAKLITLMRKFENEVEDSYKYPDPKRNESIMRSVLAPIYELLQSCNDPNILNTPEITFETLMNFINRATYHYRIEKDLAEKHPRINQIIETKNKSFCVKNELEILMSIWFIGPIGLMVGAEILVPHRGIGFSTSATLPTEYWIIAGIILATMIITTGFGINNIKSLERQLKTQDQALLASKHPTQARASQTTQAKFLTQAMPHATTPKNSVEQATTAGRKQGLRLQ